MALHVIEILLWALSCMLILPRDPLGAYKQAVYFSFVAFTPWGIGTSRCQPRIGESSAAWRPPNGIVLGSWSTGCCLPSFSVAGRMLDATGRSSRGFHRSTPVFQSLVRDGLADLAIFGARSARTAVGKSQDLTPPPRHRPLKGIRQDPWPSEKNFEIARY